MTFSLGVSSAVRFLPGVGSVTLVDIGNGSTADARRWFMVAAGTRHPSLGGLYQLAERLTHRPHRLRYPSAPLSSSTGLARG